MAVGYRIQLGQLTYAGGTDATDSRGVAGFRVDLGIGAGGGRCRVDLGPAAYADVHPADGVTVEIDAGAGATRVFSGEVEEIRQGTTALRIDAADGLAKLARLELEAAYAEVSAGFILGDLIEQAGAQAGSLEAGPSFPSYVLHRGPRALQHLRRLADLIGGDVYTDAEGKIHVQRPVDQPARQRLTWGEDIIAIDLRQPVPLLDSIACWGEGAAGTHGPERAHWLPTDLAGVAGRARITRADSRGQAASVSAGDLGDAPRTLHVGAVRSAEAAADLAQAQARTHSLRPVLGEVLALGRTGLQPSDWVELADLPTGGPDAGSATLKLRLRRVEHALHPRTGLLTRLEF